MTSTWKASDSTWLKSGLTVASTVAVEVTPYFTLTPTSGSLSAGPKADGEARSSLRVYVALGTTSSESGRGRSRSTRGAWFWKNGLSGGRVGQDVDMPSRLTRRQKRIAIVTSLPLAKRMLFQGTRISTSYPSGVARPALSHTQSGERFSPAVAVLRMSACTPRGFTKRS